MSCSPTCVSAQALNKVIYERQAINHCGGTAATSGGKLLRVCALLLDNTRLGTVSFAAERRLIARIRNAFRAFS